MFSYVVLLALATVITSFVAANWINNPSNTDWSFWQVVFAALGIFALLKIVSLTPSMGWVGLALLICMAFGAMVLSINCRRKHTANNGERPFLITKEVIS